MQIFHTSPSPITKITDNGMFGECLCFSIDVYTMSACDTLTYSIDMGEDDVIEASSFFYRDDCGLLNGIVASVMELTDCDEDQAQEYISQRDSYCDAEIDWRIQGYTGEAAKLLGYGAASAQDEQGTVYIVPMMGRESILNLH